ncbi:MAG: hypothetical protein ACI9OD_005299, partial [Limisphaerales bacterium]
RRLGWGTGSSFLMVESVQGLACQPRRLQPRLVNPEPRGARIVQPRVDVGIRFPWPLFILPAAISNVGTACPSGACRRGIRRQTFHTSTLPLAARTDTGGQQHDCSYHCRQRQLFVPVHSVNRFRLVLGALNRHRPNGEIDDKSDKESDVRWLKDVRQRSVKCARFRSTRV